LIYLDVFLQDTRGSVLIKLSIGLVIETIGQSINRDPTMKRILLIVPLIMLSACIPPTEPTNTPVPSTATPVPTETPLPSPTATPRPYYLEDGILYDQDELTGDYLVVGEGIDALTTKAEGAIAALDGEGEDLFTFDLETRAWKEVKIDPNYGYIAPELWGEESLPLIKEWWEGYKKKMPTNEDIKWMTYEDGSRVEMGEIPNTRFATSRNFGVILAGMFDFPDRIDESGHEHLLLTLLPTNSDKIEEAGNIVPIKLTTETEHPWTVSLKIIGEGGAIRDKYRWNNMDVAYNMPHKDLLRFLRAGLSGENPPLYGCQLAVSMVGTNYGSKYLPGESTKFTNSMYGEEGDGEWEVDYEMVWPPPPSGHGLFAIPESCMTNELWEVFRTLPNNPVGGN